MNPTDKVDDLLAKAGAQWRAGQPSAPEPDLDRIVQSKRPRRWVPVLAAASVAAIAAAALIVLPDHSEPQVAPVTGPTSNPPAVAQGSSKPAVAQGNTPADLLVRNGDRVEANGRIIAVPGRQPILCANVAMPLVGYAPGKEPAPTCAPEFSVKLTGVVDLDKLGLQRTVKGVRTGDANLTGIWTAGTIAVEQQAPYKSEEEPGAVDELSNVPCPAPPGGWPVKNSDLSVPAVTSFLESRTDQLSVPTIRHPNGNTPADPVVVVLGVAHGDQATFEKAFRTVFTGNLCVVRSKLSAKDQERFSEQILALPSKKFGITTFGGQGVDFDHVQVSLLVYDERVRDALAPIGDELLALDPDIKPVR